MKCNANKKCSRCMDTKFKYGYAVNNILLPLIIKNNVIAILHLSCGIDEYNVDVVSLNIRRHS